VKRVLCALGVVGALFLGSCSAMPAASPVEYVSPEGQPAGYYPGLGPTTVFKSELAAYLAKNQAGIADVQNRIVEIRQGKRTPGCIGDDKFTCVATLAQKLAVTDDVSSKDFNLFADVRYDVNGRPVNGQHVMLNGFIPNYRDIGHRSAYLTLVLGPNGTVSSVEAKLLKNFGLARTQEEYDTTSVYEIVAATAAKECPNLSKGDVARWVENTVKPRTRQTPEEHRKEAKEERKLLSEEGVHGYRSFESPRIAFCGRIFEFNTGTFTVQHGFDREPAVVPTVLIQ
jgi:hypothetical protein